MTIRRLVRMSGCVVVLGQLVTLDDPCWRAHGRREPEHLTFFFVSVPFIVSSINQSLQSKRKMLQLQNHVKEGTGHASS